MSVSTTGLALNSRSRLLREAVEVLSSMRFAIALLTVICIASVIGTVITQREPGANYVNQFGPFWAELFGRLGLYNVYSAWWFLVILAFLVISTSLCIFRNAPKILVDLRSYKEQVRASALKAFPHRGEGELDEPQEAALQRVTGLIAGRGWRYKLDLREARPGQPGGVMVAARQGAVNKLGYLAAHGAIVLICIGGLFDGDLIVQAQMALGGKQAYRGDGALSTVPPEHVLSPANPTFRGSLFVGEGQRAGVAVLNLADGIVLQPLPFEIELKKFVVDYYETGMPKLFSSQVLIRDRETGEVREETIRVNHPAESHGIAIYQSSFEDGGSRLKFKAWPLKGGPAFEVEGAVGGRTQLSESGSGEKLGLEFTGLRTINVENVARPGAGEGAAVDVRKVDLVDSVQRHLGSGAQAPTERTLRNIGPSFSYKLRDAAGQAREFNNYMLPVELDGQRVFLAGVRDNPNESFRYLRIPVDAEGSVGDWMRLQNALRDPARRQAAAARYVERATPDERPEMREALRASALRTLGIFAGAERIDPPGSTAPAGPPPAGLMAISAFLERNVPETERERTSEVLLRILNGSLLELLQQARAADGLKPLALDETLQAFMSQSLIALSDVAFFPAPVLLTLENFEQVQASVFQVTRAPGKTLVYLGCALLILGVFAMLYIRERRLWVWLEDAGEGRTRLATALSSTRQTLDTDREFEQLRTALLAGPRTEERPA